MYSCVFTNIQICIPVIRQYNLITGPTQGLTKYADIETPQLSELRWLRAYIWCRWHLLHEHNYWQEYKQVMVYSKRFLLRFHLLISEILLVLCIHCLLDVTWPLLRLGFGQWSLLSWIYRPTGMRIEYLGALWREPFCLWRPYWPSIDNTCHNLCYFDFYASLLLSAVLVVLSLEDLSVSSCPWP